MWWCWSSGANRFASDESAPNGQPRCARCARNSSRNFVTQLATGIAAAIKLTPALVIVALVAMGRRKDAARAALTVLVASAFAALVRPRDTWQYFTNVVYDTRRVGRGGQFNDSLRRVVSADIADSWRVYVALAVVVALSTFVEGLFETYDQNSGQFLLMFEDRTLVDDGTVLATPAPRIRLLY